MRKLPNGQRVMIDNGGAVRFGTITHYDPKRGAYVIQRDGWHLGEQDLLVPINAQHILTPLNK